jgi:hypothetical protein
LATKNQLAILPTFSNDPKEDKTSATEWFQKIMNNKQGGGWTDLQTVTLLRHAQRGEVQPQKDVDNHLKMHQLSIY